MADLHTKGTPDEGSVMYPPRGWRTITPADSDLAYDTVCLYVGGAGDVTATGQDGTAVVFKAVPVGTTLWGRFRRVSAATTATYILAGI